MVIKILRFVRRKEFAFAIKWPFRARIVSNKKSFSAARVLVIRKWRVKVRRGWAVSLKPVTVKIILVVAGEKGVRHSIDLVRMGRQYKKAPRRGSSFKGSFIKFRERIKRFVKCVEPAARKARLRGGRIKKESDGKRERGLGNETGFGRAGKKFGWRDTKIKTAARVKRKWDCTDLGRNGRKIKLTLTRGYKNEKRDCGKTRRKRKDLGREWGKNYFVEPANKTFEEHCWWKK